MYSRLTMFNIGPGKRNVATALADAALKMSRGMDGFINASYMIFDEEKGDYGALTLWNTKECAEAAGQKLQAWMQTEVGPHLTAPPVIKVAEVYEPS